MWLFWPFLAILGDSDDEDNKPLRSRRGGGGRSKQSRTSISNQEPVAAFPQPPKERPDARHHLKVFQHYHSLILIMIVEKNSFLKLNTNDNERNV